MVSSVPTLAVHIQSELASIDRSDWNRLANPGWDGVLEPHKRPIVDRPPNPYDPFLDWDFLEALESSGCVAADTGWLPQHLLLKDEDGSSLGAVPCYLKSHSQGEYVFDHGWADAFEHAGGHYYPKLQASVPFSPVPGSRLLVPPCSNREAYQQALAGGLAKLCDRHGTSSVHVTFLTEPEWAMLGELGYLQRIDRQFHWANQGFDEFDDFTQALSSRKRKSLRKERQVAVQDGLNIVWLSGPDIQEHHWDTFFEFYMDTGSRKWGYPYLNREFFSLLGERMSDSILLVFAYRGDMPIAGALNMIGSNTLYGRYWGCLEHHPALHFEVCYYQAIEFAIQNRLDRVEAGAQGPHKLARGYMPVSTYSAHYIANSGFRQAVKDYLSQERRHVELEKSILSERTPFRKDCGS